MAISLSAYLRNKMLVAGVLEFAGATLTFYSGTRPVNSDAVLNGNNVVLASSVLGNPAFGAPANGSAAGNPATTATVLTDGVPTWFRISKAGNVLEDGDVGLALPADAIVPTLFWQAGTQVPVSFPSLSIPAVA